MADDFDRKLRRWREAAEIAGIVGRPAQIPRVRVVQLKEKLAPLRVCVRGLPEAQATAGHAAITRAEEKSVQICKACGRPGRLRQSRDGDRYTGLRAPCTRLTPAAQHKAPR